MQMATLIRQAFARNAPSARPSTAFPSWHCFSGCCWSPLVASSMDGWTEGVGPQRQLAVVPAQLQTFRNSSVDAEIRRSANFSEFHTPEGCWILEVANDPGDEAVSISRARVPPRHATEWHRLN